MLVVDKLFDHERKRKKKMLVEEGDLTVRKGRRRSLERRRCFGLSEK